MATVSRTSSPLIRWAARPIPPPADYSAVRRAVGQAGGGILESVAVDGGSGRFSVFAPSPVAMHTIFEDSAVDPFDQLADLARPWCRYDPLPPWPFIGGWIGYVSYEAGRFSEPHGGWRSWRLSQPLMYWALFDTVLLHDACTDEWAVAGVELPDRLGAARPLLARRLEALERFAADSQRATNPAHRTSSNPRSTIHNPQSGIVCSAQVASHPAAKTAGSLARASAPPTPRWNYSPAEYLDKVERVLEYIRAGDVYQANIARRARVAFDGTPFDLYERLCASNPAAYAAFIQIPARPIQTVPMHTGMRERPATNSENPLPDWRGADSDLAILSSSPELFLRLEGRDVTTRPIKGTRPRGATPALDAAARQALSASEKDRAELNMIIDLERNDLGRVCEFGSVRVVQDGEIETHPTVFHRTATVVGRLRDHVDVIDLLRATFPGGSITGAPKVRAMQIIHELEPDARGAYCGAIGYISLNGDAQLNLAIRTMAVARPAVSRSASGGSADSLPPPAYVAALHVGSGIVADSDPEDEYRELQAKAAGMLAALNVRTAHDSGQPGAADPRVGRA